MRLAKWLQKESSLHLLCFELGKKTEKRHFHALITTSLSKSRFRQKIHEVFFEKKFIKELSVTKKINLFVGQEQLSIRELKKDRLTNFCYIAKGTTLGVFEYFGGKITLEEATAYNRQYWETNEKIMDAQSVGKLPFCDKIKQIMMESNPEDIQEISEYWKQQNEENKKTLQKRDHIPSYRMMKAHKNLFNLFCSYLGQAVKKIDTQVAGMYAGVINSILFDKLSKQELKAYTDELFDKLFRSDGSRVSLI